MFFLLFLATSTTYAQKNIIKKATPITKAEFNKHIPAIDLITKPLLKLKSHGVIELKTAKNKFVFKDNGEFLQYIYEGDLNTNSVAVIHEIETNTERYYLINKSTGKTDTLLEKPIFYTDKRSFICLEGSATDMEQRIQIGRHENNHFVTLAYIRLDRHPFIAPSYVFWYNKYTLFISTNDPSFDNTKFYKINLE